MNTAAIKVFRGHNMRQATLERIHRTAPMHPPCFHDQSEWLEWLAWCEVSDDGLSPFAAGPRAGLVGEGTQLRRSFNYELDFCTDCNASHKAEMTQGGRCRPDWLRAQRVLAEMPSKEPAECC